MQCSYAMLCTIEVNWQVAKQPATPLVHEKFRLYDAYAQCDTNAGAAMPKHQEWEAELAKELALKRSQQRNMAGTRH